MSALNRRTFLALSGGAAATTGIAWAAGELKKIYDA